MYDEGGVDHERDAPIWNESLQLGVPAMDGAHRLQTELVDGLIEAIHAGADAETVQTALLRLVDETTDHFAGEQELMRASGYPAYEAHAEEHSRLLDRISRLLSDFAAGRATLTLQTARSLRPWLIDHVQGMDRALASYLRRREAASRRPEHE